jgi:signal recognition particle GTPase
LDSPPLCPQSSKRLKKFMYMMDSMTDDELDGKVDLEKFPSRYHRRNQYHHHIYKGGGIRAVRSAQGVQDELMCVPMLITLCRIERVARGSGCHPMDVSVCTLRQNSACYVLVLLYIYALDSTNAGANAAQVPQAV